MEKLKKVILFNNEILENLILPYNKNILVSELTNHLNQYGYSCEYNVVVDSTVTRTGKGYIDMVATKGYFTYGIEIDKRSPRGRSLDKLEHSDFTEKISLIRNEDVKLSYNIGSVKVIPIKEKY